MVHVLILLHSVLAFALSSCTIIAADTDDPRGADGQADAEALLARVREVLPEGWEARLYWSLDHAELKPKPVPVDWMEDEWRSWLPGMDGRQIEVRRKEAVEYMVEAPGPDPYARYVMKEVEYMRFALTLGEARQAEEVQRRLSGLDEEIKRLEAVLEPWRYRRHEDGFVRHSVPRDDQLLRALQEYDQLWIIKRWFPQWSNGSLSVGFRSLIWLRMLPDDAKVEYRDAKKKVIGILRPVPNWQYIPADEE